MRRLAVILAYLGHPWRRLSSAVPIHRAAGNLGSSDLPEPTDETFDKIATVMSEVFNNVPRARQMIEAAMNMIDLELNGGSELSGDDEQQQARELIKWMEGLDAALAAVETFNVDEVK